MDGDQPGSITQGEIPFEDRVVPRAEIDWDRSAWWWYPITQAVVPALKLTSLLLGVAAIGFMRLGLWLGETIFKPDWSGLAQVSVNNSPTDNFVSLWYSGQTLLLDWPGIAFATFVALWTTIVCALLGGVLARRSLVQLGQRTVAPWGESLRIVFGRASSYAWLTGMHLVAFLVLLLPIWLLGLIARAGNVGANIAGILLLLAYIPVVFAVGRVCLSLIVSFPLGVCAIAAEKKADAFEGFSRSNAYLFQRPVLTALCVLALLGVGWVGWYLIFWSLQLGWGMVRSTFFLGGGNMNEASNFYVLLGNSLQTYLLAGFQFGFFWAASAALYLVLRKSVDATNLDELDSIQSPIAKQVPQIPTTPPAAAESAATVSPADSNASSDSPKEQ